MDYAHLNHVHLKQAVRVVDFAIEDKPKSPMALIWPLLILKIFMILDPIDLLST